MPLTDEETSLDDLIEVESARQSGQRCSVCYWYDHQDEMTKGMFDRHVTRGTTLRHFWKACKTKGLSTGECQFTRHVKEHHGRR